MPGMEVEEWLNPFGIVSMTVEGLFILLVVLHPWKMAADLLPETFKLPPRFVIQSASLLLVALVGAGTYQWNLSLDEHFGHHVGSLAFVCNTPETSFAELEEEYGVQVSLVATSMMGSIVDVRFKIIDPDKAHDLFEDQAALLVNQQALILAPHLHSHGGSRLKQGKIFVMFFPTNRIIVPGTQVSLVFGPLRTEPIAVK